MRLAISPDPVLQAIFGDPDGLLEPAEPDIFAREDKRRVGNRGSIGQVRAGIGRLSTGRLNGELAPLIERLLSQSERRIVVSETMFEIRAEGHPFWKIIGAPRAFDERLRTLHQVVSLGDPALADGREAEKAQRSAVVRVLRAERPF